MEFSKDKNNETAIKIYITNAGSTKATDVNFAFKVINLDSENPKNNKFGKWFSSAALTFYPKQTSSLVISIPGNFTNHRFLCAYIAYEPLVAEAQEYVDYFQIDQEEIFRISLHQKSIKQFKPYFVRWISNARKKISDDYIDVAQASLLRLKKRN